MRELTRWMIPALFAALRVDPKTQATHLMIRVPKDTHVPKHWHTANETHTVVQGARAESAGE